MRRVFLAILTLWAVAASAQGWNEPARGSAERRALMDAMRPQAELIFGPPVEFVVSRLRVADDVAFASVVAQRPGGGTIYIQATPGWQSGYFLADADWTAGQALLQRTATGWAVAAMYFGATDVWWAEPIFCAQFRVVIPEACP